MQIVGLLIFIIVAIMISIAKKRGKRSDNSRSNVRPSESYESFEPFEQYDPYESSAEQRERKNFAPVAATKTPRTSYAPTVHAADFHTTSQLTSTDFSGASRGARTKIVHSEAVAPKAQAQSAIDLNEAMNALVLGEILAKPKALRR